MTPTTDRAPFDLTYVTVHGHLGTESDVSVVHMSREEFLDNVRIVVEHGGPPHFGINPDPAKFVDVADELLQTAADMPRFPLGTWMHAQRGCGCVVGEYLIAREIIGREELATGEASVSALLDDLPNGGALYQFGSDIDEHLGNVIRRAGTRDAGNRDATHYHTPQVIVIDD